ncbi:hypothetical protein RQL81_16415 [Citrobacter braakii]|jgi:hypothetical protein|uniref:hypothetical protein n=1 Tax=Citrobacter TaxID=544 RepID=UPI0015E95BBF|nr:MULTISPECIES: hypothetical protein [Citrobacter]MCI1668356.1 hypothetical protein [Citrobacter freundii]MCI1824281.1 hypothetical protein [Citrobacter freundii]MDT7116126.1 hypothetical protein [Citrobacter braakii]QLS66111.1 hypothetical protein HV311_16600 [Citrobacter sp. RHBSTW-00881]
MEPLSLANLKLNLLSLNNSNEHPFILREDGDDIVASWNIVDAEWIDYFSQYGLQKQYELRLFFDESKKQISYREKTTDVEWDSDLGGFRLRKSVQIGQRLEFSAGGSLGKKEDGSFGKIDGYKFASTEITDPVFDIVRDAGWLVRGVLADKKKRKFVIAGAVIAALIIFIGIGTFLFSTMGDLKDAARTEIDLLRNGQYVQAYQASSSFLQRKMNSEDFKLVTESVHFDDISEYSFDSFNVVNDVGSLSGSVEFKNGESGEINVTMLKENDKWKLAAVSIE